MVPIVHKSECPDCPYLVDEHGRFWPGFCGPDCLVRRARDERLAFVERLAR